MAKLTKKQTEFVEKYIETGNASEAYRYAYECRKMKPETVNCRASELLKNGKVAARVSELQKENRERHRDVVDKTIKEISKCAFFNPGDYFNWGPDGITVKPKTTLTKDQMAAVQEVSQTVTQHGGTIRMKLVDKTKNLELLCRILGIITDGVQINNYTREIASSEADKARERLKGLYGETPKR